MNACVRECLCVSVCVYLSTVPIHCLGRFLFAISNEELYITYAPAFSAGVTVPFLCTLIVFVGIEVGVLCTHLKDCGRVNIMLPPSLTHLHGFLIYQIKMQASSWKPG